MYKGNEKIKKKTHCIPFWLTVCFYFAIINVEKEKDLSAATNKSQVIDMYLQIVSYHFLLKISRKECEILWEF